MLHGRGKVTILVRFLAINLNAINLDQLIEKPCQLLLWGSRVTLMPAR